VSIETAALPWKNFCWLVEKVKGFKKVCDHHFGHNVKDFSWFVQPRLWSYQSHFSTISCNIKKYQELQLQLQFKTSTKIRRLYFAEVCIAHHPVQNHSLMRLFYVTCVSLVLDHFHTFSCKFLLGFLLMKYGHYLVKVAPGPSTNF